MKFILTLLSGLFVTVFLLLNSLSEAESKNEKCAISIVSPADNGECRDNNSPNDTGEYTIDVKGTIAGLGDNEICLYATAGGSWYRTNEPISDLELKGKEEKEKEWEALGVSCGKKKSPHPKCKVVAVVKKSCEKIGEVVDTKNITKDSECKASPITCKTK